MRIGLLTSLAGTLLAYLIGSGVVSNQESIRYFTNRDSVGGILTAMVVNAVVTFCTFTAYTYADRHRIFDLANVYGFYYGKVVGRLLTTFAWISNTCCFFFMTSGFGSTLNQQWGLPLWAGYLIAVAFAVGTAAMRLQGIINVIGKVGPVVVTFLPLLDVITIFQSFPHVPDSVVLIKSSQVELLQVRANPVLAGLLLGGCSVLLVVAYMVSIGKRLAAYKKKYTTILCAIGTLAITVMIGILGLYRLGNMGQSATAVIPNLLVANDIFGVASNTPGLMFAIIIFPSIHSTFCSTPQTCVSTITKDEKSFKYKLTYILSGVGVSIVNLLAPYETLVNVIMTYCGYTDSIVFIVLIICWIMASRKDKLTTASGKVKLS